MPRLGCSTWFAVRFTPQNPEEIRTQYKRLLAGILSLAMLCSMASTPAYAVEDAVQSDNTAGYCMADDMVSFPLDTYSPGTAITDKDKSELQITCLPTVDFAVTQMFRNLWEYNFTQKDTLLPGTQVALFEKEENIFTHVVTYKYLRMGTTDENGRVVFADLDQYGEYVVVTGGMRKTVTLNGKTLAEIPETFRNYSLTAQTQTSQGNPGHTQAAGTAEAADAVIPQTGDASRPLVWVVLLALSGIALAGMVLCRKRKSR